MPLKAISFFTALLGVFVFAGMSSGLESDKDQDIEYSSLGPSTSRLEGNVRILTLQDNVKVTQGTLEITGDSAVFESDLDTSSINKVTVTGTPARYRQQLDDSGATTEGNGDSIQYYVEGEPVIEFIGAATLRGLNDVLSCNSIKYFTDSQFTETTGPCEGVSSRPSNNGNSPSI
jgi:lipopolysaccharide transport protein LptA